MNLVVLTPGPSRAGSSSKSLIVFRACLIGLITLAACSSGNSGPDLGGGATGSGANGSGASSSGMGGQVLSFGGSSSVGGGDTGPTGVAGGNGMAEVCDGVDNNADGIIDNVDVDNDGVCDCIRIATLGIPGTWGQGDVFGTWLQMRATQGTVGSLGSQVLSASLLAPYQILVIQDVSGIGRTYSADEVSALQTWVQNGGGVMSLIGFHDASEIVNVNTLLGAFGMSYGNKPILPKNGGSTVPITQFAAHPITQGVTAVGVDNGYAVQGAGTVYARGGGYDVGLAQEVGHGHVDVWGDEWITYNSEWQSHPDYQVPLFWVNTIKWLTPANVCQVPIPSIVR